MSKQVRYFDIVWNSVIVIVLVGRFKIISVLTLLNIFGIKLKCMAPDIALNTVFRHISYSISMLLTVGLAPGHKNFHAQLI